MLATTMVDAEITPEFASAAATKIVLIVEYDGTRYYGFQLQASLPTIQLELEKAIEKLTGERLRVMAASRTDTGVHAKGQVVSFRTDSGYSPETFVRALNYYLPRDIVVKAAHRVDNSFNVRRQAVSREYNYYILNSPTRSPLREGFYYLVPAPLDSAAMNQACQALIGEHDFSSFISSNDVESRTRLRRVYRAEVRKDGEEVVFNMVASSFLTHQVRNTVGTLIRVGLGKMSSDGFCDILEAEKPGLAWPTAPARGLCLMQVNHQNYFESGTC
ncbi:MAG: tRNA pseudouridine(38-40) synthase TruA [Dehalococcoidales bacterium]|nr:tRNA pseudouridine(38-40) synthase TruA [Dehalococcoidales bacterium]